MCRRPRLSHQCDKYNKTGKFDEKPATAREDEPLIFQLCSRMLSCLTRNEKPETPYFSGFASLCGNASGKLAIVHASAAIAAAFSCNSRGTILSKVSAGVWW